MAEKKDADAKKGANVKFKLSRTWCTNEGIHHKDEELELPEDVALALAADGYGDLA